MQLFERSFTFHVSDRSSLPITYIAIVTHNTKDASSGLEKGRLAKPFHYYFKQAGTNLARDLVMT